MTVGSSIILFAPNTALLTLAVDEHAKPGATTRCADVSAPFACDDPARDAWHDLQNRFEQYKANFDVAELQGIRFKSVVPPIADIENYRNEVRQILDARKALIAPLKKYDPKESYPVDYGALTVDATVYVTPFVYEMFLQRQRWGEQVNVGGDKLNRTMQHVYAMPLDELRKKIKADREHFYASFGADLHNEIRYAVADRIVVDLLAHEFTHVAENRAGILTRGIFVKTKPDGTQERRRATEAEHAFLDATAASFREAAEAGDTHLPDHVNNSQPSALGIANILSKSLAKEVRAFKIASTNGRLLVQMFQTPETTELITRAQQGLQQSSTWIPPDALEKTLIGRIRTAEDYIAWCLAWSETPRNKRALIAQYPQQAAERRANSLPK